MLKFEDWVCDTHENLEPWIAQAKTKPTLEVIPLVLIKPGINITKTFTFKNFLRPLGMLQTVSL